jgi:hypothetical protein
MLEELRGVTEGARAADHSDLLEFPDRFIDRARRFARGDT